MSTEINKLIDSFKKKLPDFDNFMNIGATNEEINHLENTVKQKLPNEYIELLKRYNGEKDILCCMAFGFLSIQEVLIQWNLFDNQDHKKPEKLFQENKIKESLFSNKRIPFAHDGSGNYLCIDYFPNFDGKIAQILYLPLGEPEPISVIADDFNGFITFLSNAIENNKLVLVDEREDWDEEDWEKAELYFYKTWKSDWTDIAEEYNRKN